MSLIVNADDFGLSADVNKAITECFKEKYIDRTTIMVNMPYAKEAADIAKKEGFNDKVGLHINLTQGKPLTDGIASNPLFCNENGEFNAAFYRSTLLRLHMDKKTMGDMYAEIKAQLDEYIKLGFTLNHIDSHHHVHTNYPVYKVLKKLSKEYKFSSVRLSRNINVSGSFLVTKYKAIYNKMISGICESTSDYFGSYNDIMTYYNELLEQGEQVAADFRGSCLTEVMVHPMYSDSGILMDTDTPFEIEADLYYKLRSIK